MTKHHKQPNMIRRALRWFAPVGFLEAALIELAVCDTPCMRKILLPMESGDFRQHPEFPGALHAGKHALMEFWGCTQVIHNKDKCEILLRRAASLLQVKVLDSRFVQFEPQGVTGALILSESHIAIHTWPEHGYAAVDIFTCGESDPLDAADFLKTRFGAHTVKTRLLHRGEVAKDDLMAATVDAVEHFHTKHG